MNKDRLKVIIICSIALIFGITVKVLPNYYYAKGKAALDKKEYVKAYNNLSNAYFWNHSNKDIRYYYVKTMGNLKPTEQIQKEVFKISQSRQNDSAKNLAQITVDKWKNSILSNIGNNYIEQVPSDKNIVRWSSFPIKVNIDMPSNLPDYYKEEIARAFKRWNLAAGFVSFEFVKDKSLSDIEISFKNTPSNLCDKNGCKYVVAYTTPIIKGHILKKMTITVYNKDPEGKYFTDKEIYNTLLHEIGHALGIMGHSYNPDDLMYMSSTSNNIYAAHRSDFQFLSGNDINTVTLLYKLIPTITDVPVETIDTAGLIYAPIVLGSEQDMTKRKLKEAENYIKSAPDLSGGYVDLAIVYAEMEKYPLAIKSLAKALERAKSPNERYIAYYNLAVIYLNVQKPDKALEYAKEAQGFEDTQEIRELIIILKRQIK